MHRLTQWVRDLRDLWHELDQAQPQRTPLEPANPHEQTHKLGEMLNDVDIVRDEHHAW